MPISSNGLFLLSLTILLSVSSPSSPPAPPNKQSFHINSRPDPLSSFQPYHGAYNISNSHYWASTAFTGVHGYALAGIWIVAGLGFGIYVAFKNLSCCTSSTATEAREHSHAYYLIPFLVIVLCTFLAIASTGFMLVANHNSLLRTEKLEQSILGVAKVAHGTIRRLTTAMEEMRHLLRPYNKPACVQLGLTSKKLTKESQEIQRIVYTHRHSIDRYIKIWYRSTAGIISANLVLIVAALVLLLLHWRPGFIMIIFLCWILTALCWILTGFHYFLHTFAEDTCSAFEEFQQSPGNNSLTPVVPCVDQVYADQIMSTIGYTIHKFINKLNSKLTNLNELLGFDDQGGKSLSGFFTICNPFSDAPDYNYNRDICPKDTIPISDIPDILGRFTCYIGTPNVSCDADRKFIPKAYYDMAMAYALTIQDVVNILPDIEHLARCTFVKDTFSDLLLHQCRPFRNSFKLSWLSMLSLSTIMMILELALLAKVYQNKGRIFRRCSVIPS